MREWRNKSEIQIETLFGYVCPYMNWLNHPSIPSTAESSIYSIYVHLFITLSVYLSVLLFPRLFDSFPPFLPIMAFPLWPFHSWGFIPSITLYRAMETFHITAEREKWILSNSFSSVSLYWIWMWSIPLPTFLSIYFTVLIFFLFCFFLIHWRR